MEVSTEVPIYACRVASIFLLAYRFISYQDIEIGVHIADVCHFVPHRSPLDREAQERSTTFYLVDRRFDMLPSLLSSNLCSLHGGTDRLAVSVIWTMSEDLTEVKTSWFGRTVIHSCAGEYVNHLVHDQSPEKCRSHGVLITINEKP